jgi:hypothetical protein
MKLLLGIRGRMRRASAFLVVLKPASDRELRPSIDI